MLIALLFGVSSSSFMTLICTLRSLEKLPAACCPPLTAAASDTISPAVLFDQMCNLLFHFWHSLIGLRVTLCKVLKHSAPVNRQSGAAHGCARRGPWPPGRWLAQVCRASAPQHAEVERPKDAIPFAPG